MCRSRKRTKLLRCRWKRERTAVAIAARRRDLRGREVAHAGAGRSSRRAASAWIRLDTTMAAAPPSCRSIQPVTYFRARDRRIPGCPRKGAKRMTTMTVTIERSELALVQGKISLREFKKKRKKRASEISCISQVYLWYKSDSSLKFLDWIRDFMTVWCKRFWTREEVWGII